MTAYELTDDQIMLQQMVRRLAKEKIEPYVKQIDEEKVFPKELVQLFGNQGIMGLPYPEEYGGGNGSIMDTCIVVEEMAKVDANASMVPTNQELGAMPLLIAGNKEQKEKWLPGIARGEKRISFALTEPDAGSDTLSMQTKAVKGGDYYVLNGTKRFISFSDVADYFVFFVKTNPEAGAKGISAIVAERGTPGLSIGKHEDKMGFRGFHSCEVILEDVKLPKENLLGPEGSGFKTCMITLDRTRPIVAAIGVGLAQGALDFAIQYSKERVQFGKPISEFQGLQFMMAHMAMQIEASRQLVYKAATAAETGNPKTTLYSAMAKCFATDVCMRVCVDALQILGGSGYMKDYPMEKKMRDAKLLQIVEGTNQIQRVVIASNLLK